MTSITQEAGNRHTAGHYQHESPALGSARQNRYTNAVNTASADRSRTFAMRLQGRGVASDATFRAWREDGAVRGGCPGTAGRPTRRQSEPAGQDGRDRAVLRQVPGCWVHSGCIRRKHDAGKATKKRSDERRCHYRPVVKRTHSAWLVNLNRSLPVNPQAWAGRPLLSCSAMNPPHRHAPTRARRPRTQAEGTRPDRPAAHQAGPLHAPRQAPRLPRKPVRLCRTTRPEHRPDQRRSRREPQTSA